MATKANPKNRPAAAPPIATPPAVTDQVNVQLVQPSRCRACGSTERSPYSNVRRLDHAGLAPDGRPYKQVVWRRTTCLKCNQARDDKSFE
jgi:hypothetical protein